MTSHETPDLPSASAQLQSSHKDVQSNDDTSNFGAQVPIIRATLPGEENETQERGRQTSSVAEAAPRHGSQLQIRKDGVSIAGTFIEARKFRLARSVLSLTPRKEPSFSGIQKRTNRKNEVAVFVEEKQKNRRPLKQVRSPYTKRNEHISREHQDHQSDAAIPKGGIHASTPRKRPNMSGLKCQPKANSQNKLERQHGAEGVVAKSGKTVKEPSHEWDYDSTELAEELQEIALQAYKDYQIAQSGGIAQKRPTNTVSRVLSRHGSQKSQTSNSTSADEDTEEDFVYDAYVRYDRHPLLKTTGEPESPMNTFSHELGSSSVGILNISTQEDQELWDQFADDQQSDKDWNSEEEDENGIMATPRSMRWETQLTCAAEDFYRNDYPEEEIDSEDETGRGSYDHRKVASDDEEYDEDVDAWSQDDEDVHPWKHSMGHQTMIGLGSSAVNQ